LNQIINLLLLYSRNTVQLTMAPFYGQVVAGPPGSGKTTYCTGMQEYLRLLGRDAWVINLDPANEVPPSKQEKKEHDGAGEQEEASNNLPYETLLDVCDSVVNLSSVMQQLGLGPNGGLIYCMEYLEAHVDDIVQMIQDQVTEGAYLIFDLPGQVELYTHGTAVPRLLHKLVKVLDLRLVAIQLIDAHYCTEATNFLSAALLGTTTMLRLELPTVNVLSKIDLLANYGPLPLSLDFFTECHELERLLPFLRGGSNLDEEEGNVDDGEFDYTEDPDYQKARRVTRQSPFFRKHEKLHQVLAEVVDDFGLMSFVPLDISSAESVGRVLARVDKCNGYVFKSEQANPTRDMFDCAVQSDSNYETIADIQERLAFSREHKQEEGGGESTR
jgi:GTPase SAR1 family protein